LAQQRAEAVRIQNTALVQESQEFGELVPTREKIFQFACEFRRGLWIKALDFVADL
jgi:hypothetical protein